MAQKTEILYIFVSIRLVSLGVDLSLPTQYRGIYWQVFLTHQNRMYIWCKKIKIQVFKIRNQSMQMSNSLGESFVSKWGGNTPSHNPESRAWQEGNLEFLFKYFAVFICLLCGLYECHNMCMHMCVLVCVDVCMSVCTCVCIHTCVLYVHACVWICCVWLCYVCVCVFLLCFCLSSCPNFPQQQAMTWKQAWTPKAFQPDWLVHVTAQRRTACVVTTVIFWLPRVHNDTHMHTWGGTKGKTSKNRQPIISD